MAWLTSAQALARLGTKPQSLYASVSRGRIRVRLDPDDSRRRLYDGDDVGRLAGHPAGRRRSAAIAADAISWGDPVLPSAISTIAGGRLYYRGRDAVALADTSSLEDIAMLLWETGPISFAGELASPPTLPPLRRGLAAMVDRATADAPLIGRTAAELRQEMPALVGILATAFGAAPAEIPLHRRLAAAWRRPEAAGLLRRVLVLLADHELTASTFAARIAASTGAPLAATMLAGLATLTGPRHGGAPAAITALVATLQRDGARPWFSPERALPGFGHRLYPAGDPRAAALLDDIALPPGYAAYLAIGHDLTGEAPNVDFALAALAAACDLPPDAPLLLFALARSVGWLAHALEQHSAGTPIRPRAHYVGPSPAPEPASPAATTEGGSRLAPLAPHHEVE